MPELPEVERGRILLERKLLNQKISQIEAPPDSILYKDCDAQMFKSNLHNQHVKCVQRKGKYLWLETDQKPMPVFHFGMTGDFCLREPKQPEPKHTRFSLTAELGTQIDFIDPRRFGRVYLLSDPNSEPPLSRLGFDPLTQDIPFPWLQQILKTKNTTIKAFLLKQNHICGIGNWLADDILLAARISPHRACSSFSSIEVKELIMSAKEIIHTAVAAGAMPDRFPSEWLFHIRWLNRPSAREEREQRDLTDIRFDRLGGRTTVWNTAVQK